MCDYPLLGMTNPIPMTYSHGTNEPRVLGLNYSLPIW